MLSALAHLDPPVVAAIASVLGLLVGSFLNVAIYRLPIIMERDWAAQCAELRGEAPPVFEHLGLATPRSRCPHCGHRIGAAENIPVVSYLLLRGKCSSCAQRISPRYPAVEALTGLLSGYAAWRFGISSETVGALLMIWSMIALTFIDFDKQLLPDSITLPLLWVGLVFNLGSTFTDLRSAVIGAIAGYLLLWAVYWLFKLTTGKEGMGYGDFKLLAAIGAWFGWQMLPLAVLASSVVGAVVGITLIVATRRGRNVPIPFGPYLAGAAIIVLFWGKLLTRHYLGLL